MKSPLKDKPLRNPGQSLDRYILDVILDQQIKYVFYGFGVGAALISNWSYYFAKKPLPPILFTLIHHNGFKDDKLLVQVKAEANWLKQIIKESAGKDVDVKKVVLFPGWFIEPTAESKQSDVWVLEPKALPAFIFNSGERLCGEDLSLVGFHLSRFVRIG
jgi:hypothetical protein